MNYGFRGLGEPKGLVVSTMSLNLSSIVVVGVFGLPFLNVQHIF